METTYRREWQHSQIHREGNDRSNAVKNWRIVSFLNCGSLYSEIFTWHIFDHKISTLSKYLLIVRPGFITQYFLLPLFPFCKLFIVFIIQFPSINISSSLQLAFFYQTQLHDVPKNRSSCKETDNTHGEMRAIFISQMHCIFLAYNILDFVCI
jgi:hypothetical protein